MQADGTITAAGAALHDEIEAHTDDLALAAWARLGKDRTVAVEAALLPLARRIHAAAVIRQPNPMGLPPLPER
jgi:hypothetical protein